MKLIHPLRRAFTLIELLIVSVIIVLLGLLLPALSRAKVKANFAACASNMKQVSLAFIVWVNDNEKEWLPWRVDVSEGGTKNHASGLQHNLWFQYAWISNELLNPRVLACPSDKLAKPAATFTATAQGGFLNPTYQDAACSYDLGVDGPTNRLSGSGLMPFEVDFFVDNVLIWDRNVDTKRAPNGSCSSGLDPVFSLSIGSPWVRRPNYGHGVIGNVGLNDGSIQTLGQEQFGGLAAKSPRESSSFHCLQPRPAM